jgi:hypothetical protein
MFRALLAHLQEALHKRHLVYCACYVGWLHQDWSRIVVGDTSSNPILLAANWHNTHAIYQVLFFSASWGWASNARNMLSFYYFLWLCSPVRAMASCSPVRAMASSFSKFRDHTQRRATVGRTPVNEWSACRKDFYLTHNTHKRQISKPPLGFEPTITAGERP